MVDFEKMSDEILAIDEVMRYVGFTDLKGSIVYNKMKKGKTSLKNQEQERKFSTDLSTIKKMQEMFIDQRCANYPICDGILEIKR